MKTLAVLLILVLTLTACTSMRKGPAYDVRAEFPALIEQHPYLAADKWKVQEIRFSHDYEKALVIFKERKPDPARSKFKYMSPPELVLSHDGFGRYKGNFRGEGGAIIAIDLHDK